MPLETATYVPDLNVNNPAHTDQLNQADAHIRLLKAALKTTFENFTADALQATQAEIDAVAHTKQLAAQDGSSGAPSITFASDATAGFRKGSLAGQTLIAGVLRGSGAVPMGAIVDFPKIPTSFTNNGIPAGGPYDWIELDGSQYTFAQYPELGAFLGSTFGGDGTTTFRVPNLVDTGRFRRSRSSSLAAGTYQANTFKTHTHTVTEDVNGGHAHTITISDPGHTHGLTPSAPNVLNPTGSGVGGFANAAQTISTLSVNTAVTGITASSNFVAGHTHTPVITAGSDGGGSETRPESFAVVVCIKT